jgi:hypothetical protein
MSEARRWPLLPKRLAGYLPPSCFRLRADDTTGRVLRLTGLRPGAELSRARSRSRCTS